MLVYFLWVFVMTSLIEEGVKELQSYFDQNSPNMLKASVTYESETLLITPTDNDYHHDCLETNNVN